MTTHLTAENKEETALTVTRNKRYTWFVGTDISKNKLDHAVMKGTKLLFVKETGNDPSSIKEFILGLKSIEGFSIAKAVFCIENTGFYGNLWINGLKRFKANVVRENSKSIMNAQGTIRGKSDQIDAVRIAMYAYLHREQLRLFSQRRPVLEQLQQLSTLRNRLTGCRAAMTVPLQESAAFLSKKSNAQLRALSERTLSAMKMDAEEIDQRILQTIKEDENLNRLYEIITSIPHLGPVTAAAIIIATNEFKDISSPKKFACYAGVAPFPRESGIMQVRKRVSPIANRRMKSLIHLCALQAMRFSPELKPYFIRKTEDQGKAKMLVINAIRYKLILRIFACVNQNRKYEMEYLNPRFPTASSIPEEAAVDPSEHQVENNERDQPLVELLDQ